jgi:transposase
LKVLLWEGAGMVLTDKVPEPGKFAWPKVQDGVLRLSRAQLEGLDRRRVMARRVPPTAAAG